jgi:transcriptional regulator
MSKPTDHIQGTLDLLILKIIALSPQHGWAISQRLKQISTDVLQVSDGSLYPALHKLEQDGWIASEWKASENNRKAKFYSLTRVGRKHLEKETAHWVRLSSAISHVLSTKEV